MKQTDFKIGDIVTWTSHSPKNKTTKTGTIICIVEPKQSPKSVFNNWHQYHLSISYRTPKRSRSYLVVKQFTKSTRTDGYARKPKQDKLYFPFPNTLRKVL
jgi:hypothetical protein